MSLIPSPILLLSLDSGRSWMNTGEKLVNWGVDVLGGLLFVICVTVLLLLVAIGLGFLWWGKGIRKGRGNKVG